MSVIIIQGWKQLRLTKHQLCEGQWRRRKECTCAYSFVRIAQVFRNLIWDWNGDAKNCFRLQLKLEMWSSWSVQKVCFRFWTLTSGPRQNDKLDFETTSTPVAVFVIVVSRDVVATPDADGFVVDVIFDAIRSVGDADVVYDALWPIDDPDFVAEGLVSGILVAVLLSVESGQLFRILKIALLTLFSNIRSALTWKKNLSKLLYSPL
jgi:hypothetical protein